MVKLEDYENSQITKGFIEDVYPTDIEKGKAGHEGLIPVIKTVNDRGRTYQRRYWVKPQEMTHFKGTAPAVEFLMQTLDSQKELASMMEQLEKYNTQLAAEIYNQMIKNGEQAIKINDKIMAVSTWTTNRETNVTALLAGMKHLINAKGKIDMGDIAKTYADVSYQYKMSGLELQGTDEEGKVKTEKKLSVIQDLVPMGWVEKVKEVGAALRSNIKEGLKMVRVLYQKLGREEIPPQKEELDYRRKENAGKLDDLYEEYQGKRVLTDKQKLDIEGRKATKPGEKKLVVKIKPISSRKD